ncbi:hypothetical protein PtrSN002B_012223 [Pyrenophora tritici-repentis]|nr:hypothetical protein PtrSN002B_012223 [Pyrenophora tritici-repentis]
MESQSIQERGGKEFQPPGAVDYAGFASSVFLAGSIEMGKATEWQRDVMEQLKDLPVAVLNPRRDDWDSSWKQRASDPNFLAQVTWELEGLEKVDTVLMYLEPGTVSIISMLELGILVGRLSTSLVLCCPEDFHRIGNVEVTAKRYGVPVFDTLSAGVKEVRRRIQEKAEASGHVTE